MPTYRPVSNEELAAEIRNLAPARRQTAAQRREALILAKHGIARDEHDRLVITVSAGQEIIARGTLATVKLYQPTYDPSRLMGSATNRDETIRATVTAESGAGLFHVQAATTHTRSETAEKWLRHELANRDKLADAAGAPGDVPPGYDRSDWNA